MSKKPEIDEKRTLTADQIESDKTVLGRRTALKALGATVLGVSATSVAGCIVVPARTGGTAYQTGVTDSDGGQYADPAGNGRGGARNVYTGLTDSDGGSYADQAGYGRGRHGQQGYSSGMTDSDGGAYADPAGNGRGTARLGYTGMTDSDGGSYADQAGHGRGRR